MSKIELLQGDCLIEMKNIPDNSVDAIITDPPYGLKFMGKHWDKGVPGVEFWQEIIRVLKPGGHLLAFSGTRTYHRMAVAIEDAGFEIRDMIEWVYGSGFPKSLNIGKAVDKLQGNERESEIVKGKIFTGSNNNISGVSGEYEVTKGTSEWEGWGSQLKPSHEPICFSRKPLEKGLTISENCLKWGTGGINIDESRVEHNEPIKKMKAQEGGNKVYGQSGRYEDTTELKANGRFPANLIHDNSEEVRECFPETKSGNLNSGHKRGDGTGNSFMGGGGTVTGNYGGDSGNASRFFKSIKKDLHCSLCYDTIEVNQLTRRDICKHTNVNNAEKSSENTQGIKESIAQKNATGSLKENLVQNVKYAGNLCDLCGTFIAHEIVGQKTAQSLGLIPGRVTITEPNLRILKKCLASFVELRENTDTIPTMENLNLLFGYVLNAIDNSTQNYGVGNEKERNHTPKSLLYVPKASKSERNKGCEGLEEKFITEQNKWTENDYRKGDGEKTTNPTKNFHPTVKPIALMEYLIKMVTPKGGVVLDPFMGSGTTGIACKNLNRNFIGIELEEEYYKIAEVRINNTARKLF